MLFSLLLNFIMASGIFLVISKESELQAERLKQRKFQPKGKCFRKFKVCERGSEVGNSFQS